MLYQELSGFQPPIAPARVVIRASAWPAGPTAGSSQHAFREKRARDQMPGGGPGSENRSPRDPHPQGVATPATSATNVVTIAVSGGHTGHKCHEMACGRGHSCGRLWFVVVANFVASYVAPGEAAQKTVAELSGGPISRAITRLDAIASLSQRRKASPLAFRLSAG